MLTKDTVIDKVEVLEDGAVQVRYATYLVEDGVRGPLLGYHRQAFGSQEAIPDEAPEKVRDIAKAGRKKGLA